MKSHISRREVVLAATAAACAPSWSATAQAPPAAATLQRPGAASFRVESLTQFEKALLERIRHGGTVQENIAPPPAYNNARGVALIGGSAAILNPAVWGRKYGITLDGTSEVLIKNFTFTFRRSNDQFGAGLSLGGKAGTVGETYLSNAYIDLKEPGPNPDYRLANNEAVSIEAGNRPLNVRRAVLIGAEESGLDNKGDVRIDASFIAAGHRSVRIWSGGSLILANSVVLAYPEFTGFWFGGGNGVARLAYFNCLFGRVGDGSAARSSTIPDWMISRDEGIDARIVRLTSDPFSRKKSSFWISTTVPAPPGF